MCIGFKVCSGVEAVDNNGRIACPRHPGKAHMRVRINQLIQFFGEAKTNILLGFSAALRTSMSRLIFAGVP